MTATKEVMTGKLTRLRHTIRFSAIPTLYKENVAEHGYWTAIIAMAIVADIDIPQAEGTYRLMGDVAMKALWHDIEESMTGDVVRDLKYATPEIREAMKHVEEQFVEVIFKPMGVAGLWLKPFWTHAKDDTRSGHIVALADLLCVISYCNHDIQLGNNSEDLFRIRKQCLALIQEKTKGTELELFARRLIKELDHEF